MHVVLYIILLGWKIEQIICLPYTVKNYLEVPGKSSNIVQEGYTLDMTNRDEMVQVRVNCQ